MLDTQENEPQIPKMTLSALRRHKTRRLTPPKGKTGNLTETKTTPDRGTDTMTAAPEQEIDLRTLDKDEASLEAGEDSLGQDEPTSNTVDPTTAWKLEMARFFQQMRCDQKGSTGETKKGADLIIQSRMAATEAGPDMRTFLTLAEREFREMGIAEAQWGVLIRKYLTGRAATQWNFVVRSGIDMTDWQLVCERLCERFLGYTRDVMLSQMKENEWTGNYNEYCNEFSDIVSNGEELPEHDLIMYFLAGLPTDIGDELTDKGKRTFSTWNEAANALRAYMVPFNLWRAQRKRALQELQGAEKPRPKRRSHLREYGEANRRHNEAVYGVNRKTHSTGRSTMDGERDTTRCFECTGQGHLGRECPLRNGVARRRGETCSKCGGMDHYARDCATNRRTPNGNQRVITAMNAGTREGESRLNEKA